MLFTLDETTYSRELAPLAGHYPAVRLGPAWWFHDSVEGMTRYRQLTTETAGIYNTAGFNDDTRAFCSIPARHDLARRVDANWLGGLVARHVVEMDEARAMARALAYELARDTYRFACVRSDGRGRQGLGAGGRHGVTAAPTRLARAVRVHPTDDVAVAVDPLEPGDVITVGDETVNVREAVPAGHKVALRAMRAGDVVHKYGWAIGALTRDVEPGDWIHSHNLKTQLEGTLEYAYEPTPRAAARADRAHVGGLHRADGRVGTRNEIWVINTVGCVNWAAEKIARSANERFAGVIDGVHAFAHPYRLQPARRRSRRTRGSVLAGLMRHPNAGGVLVLGLGCENNQMDALLAEAGDVDRSRIRFFNTQDVFDEVQSGVAALDELVERMARRPTRDACPRPRSCSATSAAARTASAASRRIRCVGRVADRLTARGRHRAADRGARDVRRRARADESRRRRAGVRRRRRHGELVQGVFPPSRPAGVREPLAGQQGRRAHDARGEVARRGPEGRAARR